MHVCSPDSASLTFQQASAVYVAMQLPISVHMRAYPIVTTEAVLPMMYPFNGYAIPDWYQHSHACVQ